MSCDCAHCAIGECNNFYVENGVRKCLRGFSASGHKGQNLGNPLERLQQQFQGIKRQVDLKDLKQRVLVLEGALLLAKLKALARQATDIYISGYWDDTKVSLLRRVETLRRNAVALHKAGLWPSRSWLDELREEWRSVLVN
jgi:hypothetical protein